MEGWYAHTTLNWSWVLSLQSQTRLFSEPATEEQGFLWGQETRKLAAQNFTHPTRESDLLEL